MTLDEAIKRYKDGWEIFQDNYLRCPWSDGHLCNGLTNCRMLSDLGKDKGCVKMSAEYKQIASWLKELKGYRERMEDDLK